MVRGENDQRHLPLTSEFSLENGLMDSDMKRQWDIEELIEHFTLIDGEQISLPMTVTLLLRSQGQAYPDDWYAGTFKVSTSLPSPLFVPSAVGLLPIDLRIAADSNMSNYSMKIEPGVTDASFDLTGKSPDATFGPN